MIGGTLDARTPAASRDPRELSFELPPELIAQTPADRRDHSRLLVLDRAARRCRHDRFRTLPRWLRPGDLLVRNESKVLAARLRGTRPGGGKVEVLLLERKESGPGYEVWTCLARPGRRLKRGATAELASGLAAEWLDDGGVEGVRHVKLLADRPVAELLDDIGEVPLPPYIHRPPEALDRERYQTVYARAPGSVAAPTAGLHFTEDLLQQIAGMGVEVVGLTLHVGPATFLPPRRGSLRLPSEAVDIPEPTAAAVSRAQREDRRVVAVGTTTVRALEGACAAAGLESGRRRVDVFVEPGYRFQIVDALITNFHLPGSTPLGLVAALAGTDLLLAAYREAVRERYRFYSYGDAMLVV